jgi:hypothetical protein
MLFYCVSQAYIHKHPVLQQALIHKATLPTNSTQPISLFVLHQVIPNHLSINTTNLSPPHSQQ